MLWEITALIIAAIFFLLGIAGTIAPMLPGPPLVWLGMLIYGFITGFQELDWVFFLLQAGLVGVIMGIDYLTTIWGTRYSGGSRAAFWGATLGFLIGVIFFSLPGLLLGPFLGALLGELMVQGQFKQAVRSGLGAVIGLLGGIPVKIFLEIVMILWFIIAVW